MKTRPTLTLALLLGACAAAEPPTSSELQEANGYRAFNVPALLDGAFSDVPDSALAQYPAVLGGSLTRHTAITGIEFHIPGVISSHAMSSVPVPLSARW
jgi:hypothetical protein